MDTSEINEGREAKGVKRLKMENSQNNELFKRAEETKTWHVKIIIPYINN